MDVTMMSPVEDINEKENDKKRGRKHHKHHKRSRK
jgi:hypothetical protein